MFRIVDATTREVAPDPMALAIRENKTVCLTANCVLIRRDGFATGGTYQEYGLFLLTRSAAGAPLKVLRSFSDGY